MKILLDESVPQKLRLRIDTQHEVFTTAFQSWSGLKNGALLTAAEEAGFEVFITSDQEIYYQQNLVSRRIAILVLGTNNWGAIQLRIPEINSAIDVLSGPDYRFLDVDG